MDIPQNILNKFIVRKDYLDWINQETSIFAYLDLTNMLKAKKSGLLALGGWWPESSIA